jgi:hypothetical protein
MSSHRADPVYRLSIRYEAPRAYMGKQNGKWKRQPATARYVDRAGSRHSLDGGPTRSVLRPGAKTCRRSEAKPGSAFDAKLM